jgi:hypothetical protein
VSQPIQVGQKYVVAQLNERSQINPEEFAKAKDDLRRSLLTPKKDRVFQSYIDSVRDKMAKAGKIKIDEAEFANISRRI